MLSFAGALLLASFVEYATHRWLLHRFPRMGHAHHHRKPGDYSIGWSIPAIAAGVAFIVGGTFAAGLLVWYCGYLWLHTRFHHRPFARGPLLRLQQHHEQHHANARVNFGVSTSLWDRLLRTRA